MNTQVKKVTLGLILGWVLGVVAAISGIIQLFSKPLTGILVLLLSAVLLPPVNKLIADKFKFTISGGLKFILIIVLIGLIGASMSSGSASSSDSTSNKDGSPSDSSATQTQNTAPAEPPIEITAIALYDEFEENQVAAEQKYKGKTLIVSGTVDSIGTDILNTPYVSLRSSNEFLTAVQCMFDRSDSNALVSLKKDQKIKLSGTVSSKLLHVIMKNCQVVQ